MRFGCRQLASLYGGRRARLALVLWVPFAFLGIEARSAPLQMCSPPSAHLRALGPAPSREVCHQTRSPQIGPVHDTPARPGPCRSPAADAADSERKSDAPTLTGTPKPAQGEFAKRCAVAMWGAGQWAVASEQGYGHIS
ncbi:hypothetical protein C8T65DRAFT_294306 [Cerioporus squamosus]|nr:hypothetical protein C8T65DRAFT_294306 [Cerioporus squamosus]